jgi:hypothetical protein
MKAPSLSLPKNEKDDSKGELPDEKIEKGLNFIGLRGTGHSFFY